MRQGKQTLVIQLAEGGAADHVGQLGHGLFDAARLEFVGPVVGQETAGQGTSGFRRRGDGQGALQRAGETELRYDQGTAREPGLIHFAEDTGEEHSFKHPRGAVHERTRCAGGGYLRHVASPNTLVNSRHSASGRNGFVRYPLAPQASNSRMRRFVESVDTITTGIARSSSSS